MLVESEAFEPSASRGREMRQIDDNSKHLRRGECQCPGHVIVYLILGRRILPFARGRRRWWTVILRRAQTLGALRRPKSSLRRCLSASRPIPSAAAAVGRTGTWPLCYCTSAKYSTPRAATILAGLFPMFRFCFFVELPSTMISGLSAVVATAAKTDIYKTAAISG